MIFEKALLLGKEALKMAGIEEYDLDAWNLMEYACGINRSQYYIHAKTEMETEEFHKYDVLLKKRIERIPLQYLTGEQEFMGFPFKVNSHVLIPRQDTETLVETALEVLEPGMSVLDLCTGSGCIIISLKKLAKPSEGIKATGSDVSKQALLVAKENAKRNGVEVEWVSSDLFGNLSGTFDMIVSNPPYIPSGEIGMLMPEVSHFEPWRALDGHEDGLHYYRSILEHAKEYLNPNGYLLFEIGYDQEEAVSEMMEKAGFSDIKAVQDLSGLNRVVWGRSSS